MALKIAHELFDLIYPIGSIYMSVNSTNPSTYFGGTWKQWGKGRVPVGVDTSQVEFNTVEKTGGSMHIQDHFHLVDSAAGSHVSMDFDGGATIPNSGVLIPYRYVSSNMYDTPFVTAGPYNVQTGNSGNLQPYITCYMWKRTG